MIKDAIAKVVDRVDLTEAEAEAVMREIMEGQATPAQIAGYVTALRMMGEVVDEITGSARAMRAKAVRIRTTDSVVVDTCGTGGDGGQPSTCPQRSRSWWRVRESPWPSTATVRSPRARAA